MQSTTAQPDSLPSPASPSRENTYCHKSDLPLVHNDGMPDDRISRRSALAIISGLHADVLALRNQFGIHRQEVDPKRREAWEISAAKTYVLNLARLSLESLPAVATDSDDLLFHKLNLNLFREWLVGAIQRAESAKLTPSDVAVDLLTSNHFWRAEALHSALAAFDDLGNAGVQPKDKEKKEQSPIGKPPVTAAAHPRLADLAELLPGLNQRLTRHHLTSISEWCLDRLEEMEPVRWSPSAGAVGEGDMGFDD
jgi:hypothetical protein